MEELVENQWIQCVRDGKKEIELTETLLAKILEVPDKLKAPLFS